MTTWKQIDEMQQRPTSEEDAQLIREWETYHSELLLKATPEQKDELCMRALRIQRLVAFAGGTCYNLQYKDEWDALYDATGNVFGFADPIEDSDGENQ